MNDPLVAKLLLAADQRFTSAEVLLANQMYLDSMYLSGYTAECSLKALLLANVPERRRKRFSIEAFRGAKAHDFEHLKELLKKRHVSIPSDVSAMLRKLARWAPELRYEVGRKSSEEARGFLDAAAGIRTWVRRNI